MIERAVICTERRQEEHCDFRGGTGYIGKMFVLKNEKYLERQGFVRGIYGFGESMIDRLHIRYCE